MLDRIDAIANEIMKQERIFGTDENISYALIRRRPDFCGFTSLYFYESANFTKFSSSADISTMLKLAKLDLMKGTQIAELVFSCCKWFPKKKAIQSLIELGGQRYNGSEDKVVKSVMKFQSHEGINCLIGLFQTPIAYNTENDLQDEFGLVFRDLEESCLYLIQLVKDLKLDSKKILNHTTLNGTTLFNLATCYSEKITKLLLDENIQVNSINHQFVTPSFEVRFLRSKYFLENYFSFSSKDKQ